MTSDPSQESELCERGVEALLCVDLGLGLYSDDRCIDPPRCQLWGYCLQCPETLADD
jgi:hypothetical protein